ncbi:MAG: outer membrane beta-barrel protein [Terriglobales bacterium]|jgi:opacity protein-like surface antigen
MNAKRLSLVIALLILVACLPAMAQSNELGVMGGFLLPHGGSLDTSTSGALEGFIAHRLFKAPMVGVFAELPVVGGLSAGAANVTSSASYSSLFITPGVKVKLSPPVFPLGAYAVAGAGYARFNGSNAGVSGEESANKFVFDFGGGLEMKVVPHVSVRAEIREYETSSFDILNVTGITGHNLAVLFGVGLKL